MFPPATLNGVTHTMLRLLNDIAAEGAVTKEKALIFKPLSLAHLPTSRKLFIYFCFVICIYISFASSTKSLVMGGKRSILSTATPRYF